MRPLNADTLRTLGIAFNAAYQNGLGMAPADYEAVSTMIMSATATEEYGWLGQFPGVREWLGERVLNAIGTHRYAITNRDFEDTVTVGRNSIEDDNIGIYTPMFMRLGQAAAAFPNKLVYGLLANGFTTPCYDNQNFFDASHPIINADGSVSTVANTDGGGGAPWFLIDDSQVLKPLIFQKRKDWQFVAKDRITDDNLFMRKEFIYGVDARMNAGFGFWQFAWGSKQPLDPVHYALARASIAGLKGDDGNPLGLGGKLLVCPPSLEGAARALLVAERDQFGATNVWQGTARLLVTPWLA